MLDGVSLDQLRTFIAAADEGSFSAGGRRLRRAQSVVSQTLANLETQLGVKLFDRSSRSPVLTKQGVALLAEARAVVGGMDVFKARAKGLSDGLEPELSVVVDVVFPLERLTAAVAAFQEKFPAVPFRLNVEALGAVLQPVMDGRCAAHTRASAQRGMGFCRVPDASSGVTQSTDSSACACATSTTRPHGPVGAVARKRFRRFFRQHLAARRPRREARLPARRSGLGRHAGGRSRSRPGKWIAGENQDRGPARGSPRHGDVGSVPYRHAAWPGRALADRTSQVEYWARQGEALCTVRRAFEIRPSADHERRDLVAFEPEDEPDLDRTAGEFAGESVGDDGLVAFPGERQRLDPVLVFLLGFGLPSLDGGQTLDGSAFVPHDGIFGEALRQRVRVPAILGGDVESDGCWKIDGHTGYFNSSRSAACPAGACASPAHRIYRCDALRRSHE